MAGSVTLLRRKLQGAFSEVQNQIKTADATKLRQKALASIRNAKPADPPSLLSKKPPPPPLPTMTEGEYFMTSMKRFFGEATDPKSRKRQRTKSPGEGPDDESEEEPGYPSPVHHGKWTVRGCLPEAPQIHRERGKGAVIAWEDQPPKDKYAIESFKGGFRAGPAFSSLQGKLFR